MNRIFFSFLFLTGLLSRVRAQECATYFMLTKGANVEISLYDDKQKLSGRQEWTVREVTGKGNQIQSTADLVMYNGEGRELARAADVAIRCNDGQYAVDIRSLMMNGAPVGTPTSGQSDGEMALYPKSLQVGMTLADASFTADTSPGGLPIRARITLKNRKVEGQEMITTPVGAFNCYKITYNSQIKVGLGFTSDNVEWFAPGTGVVKSESYRKGKLIGSTMLTKFTKGKAQTSAR